MPTSSSIQRLSWNEIKSEIAIINKDLFDIIEEINPSDRYALYKVSYPFGAKIVDNGSLHLPSEEGHLYPLSNAAFSSELSEELNYAPIPLALILSKSCEKFIENDQQVISLSLLSAKQLFGLFGVLEKDNHRQPKQLPWSITAGSRSLFMLPKITDMNAHRRIIRTYKVQAHPPASSSDHWQIFTTIANNTDAKESWHCEVLFFSKAWMSEQKDTLLWSKFNNYLYTQAWAESAYLRNKTILNLLWEILASSMIKDLKLKAYSMQTIKQLTAVAYGFAPGYKAAGKDETIAPISAIEEAYVNVYELKEYLPIIMYPSNISNELSQGTYYYSLSADILYEGSLTTIHPPRIINKLREIKELMDIANRSILNNPLLQRYLNDDIHYQYFHTVEDKESNIQSSKDIPSLDPTLIETCNAYPDRTFPAASPFMRGCVSMTTSRKMIPSTEEAQKEGKKQQAETAVAFNHAADPVTA